MTDRLGDWDSDKNVDHLRDVIYGWSLAEVAHGALHLAQVLPARRPLLLAVLRQVAARPDQVQDALRMWQKEVGLAE